MADAADFASDLQEQVVSRSLAQRATRSWDRETPDEDEAGNRYCLDCAEIIPPARVEAVDAARCIYCAQKRERKVVGM